MQEQSYINIPLNKKMEEFSKDDPRNLQGISLKNCIIISTPEFFSYSFIEPVLNNADVNFELVSIIEYLNSKHDKSTKKVEILKRKLEFETITRLLAKNIDQVEVKIQTNRKALSDSHIAQIKVQKKGKNHKSMFFIFTFDANMVESKDPIQTTKLKESKNIRQSVNRVLWLPSSKNLFLQLFSQEIILYSWDGFEEQQVALLKLKSLKINEPFVDCSFAENRSSDHKSLLIALGQSGSTYIIAIANQQSEQNEDQGSYFKLEQAIQTSQKFNWESIKAISANFNKTDITLLVKTAYTFKNDRSQPILKIYSLQPQSKENEPFKQNLLIESNGNLDKQKQQKLQILSNSLVKNSLYFFVGKKLIKLKLHKHLQYISNRSNKNYNEYCPIDQSKEMVIQINEKQKTVFLHIGQQSIFLLRKLIQLPIYSYQNIPLDKIQFQSSEKSIKSKVQALLKKMRVQVSKIDKYQEPIQAKFSLQLSQTTTLEEINKFNEELVKFISEQAKMIDLKKTEITQLETQVKKSSSKVINIYSKKGILNTLMEKIQKNKKQIEHLLEQGNEENNDSKDKINEINDMIEYIRGKDIDLSDQLKKEFIRVIKKNEADIYEIKKKVDDAEAKLKNNK